MKQRICTDTSVIGGCLDIEFAESSGRLPGTFERGDATMVLSTLTMVELLSAPAGVRAVVEGIPNAHRELIEMTVEAATRAERYVDAGAIGDANRIDAQQIALATVNHVSVLVSWNLRHIVNLRWIGIQLCQPA